MKIIQPILPIFLLLLSTPLIAQHSIGFRTGVNFSNQGYYIDEVDINTDHLLGWTMSIPYEFGVSQHFFIQTEISFTQKGAKYVEDNNGQKTENRICMNYIGWPLLAKYKFGKSSFKASIAMGPTVGYSLHGEQHNGDLKTDMIFDDQHFKRWEISGSYAIGLEYHLASGYFFSDFRHLVGGSDISRLEGVKLSNVGIATTLGYMIQLGSK